MIQLSRLSRKLKSELDVIRYRYRRIFTRLLLISGNEKYLLKNRSGKRAIGYHGVDRVGCKKYSTKFISAKVFEEHLQYYRNNFRVVSLEEFYLLPENPEQFTVTLTFDDGYLNNLTYVLPLLEKYQIPATFFVTGVADQGEDALWADLIDIVSSHYKNDIEIGEETFSQNWRGNYTNKRTGQLLKQQCKVSSSSFKRSLFCTFKTCLDNNLWQELADYWMQMNIEQIKEASQSPWVTIGSHGFDHNNLGDISFEYAKEELFKSKAFLEKVTEQTVDAIAFPCGSYSSDVLSVCNDLGLTKQLAVAYLFDEDASNAFIHERIGINPYIGVRDQMISILRGHYY